ARGQRGEWAQEQGQAAQAVVADLPFWAGRRGIQIARGREMKKQTEYDKLMKELEQLRAQMRREMHDNPNITGAQTTVYPRIDEIERLLASGQYHRDALAAGNIKFGEDE